MRNQTSLTTTLLAAAGGGLIALGIARLLPGDRAVIQQLQAQVQQLRVDLPSDEPSTPSPDHPSRVIDGDVVVSGELAAESLSSKGPLSVGTNTLVLANDVRYPPESVFADFIFSARAGSEAADLAIARLDGPMFSHIEMGIGLGDPQHRLHLHNGPLAPFVADRREVRAGFTNADTGRQKTDGLVVGIDEDGVASINQNENLPMTMATNGAERMRINENGQVGIGTSAPTAMLEVAGTVDVQAVRFPDNTMQTTAANPISSFDSGWFSVTTNRDYVLSHNLGTTAVVGSIWFSKNASGTDRFYGPAPMSWREHNPERVSGATIRAMDTMTATVRTGNDFRIPSTSPSPDGHEGVSSGFVRVVLIAAP